MLRTYVSAIRLIWAVRYGTAVYKLYAQRSGTEQEIAVTVVNYTELLFIMQMAITPMRVYQNRLGVI